MSSPSGPPVNPFPPPPKTPCADEAPVEQPQEETPSEEEPSE